jgi:phage gpG-like protein
MRKGAPVDMGRLRGSLTNRPVTRSDTQAVDAVGSALRYARMREFGGVIRPVRRPRLAWRSPLYGFRTALMVTQRPGGRTNGWKPWMRPAVAQYPDLMEQEVRR